jgi:hypothetical protein
VRFRTIDMVPESAFRETTADRMRGPEVNVDVASNSSPEVKGGLAVDCAPMMATVDGIERRRGTLCSRKLPNF